MSSQSVMESNLLKQYSEFSDSEWWPWSMRTSRQSSAVEGTFECMARLLPRITLSAIRGEAVKWLCSEGMNILSWSDSEYGLQDRFNKITKRVYGNYDQAIIAALKELSE